MRAAFFHGIGQPLSVEQAPEPQPEDGDLVLSIAACGICGSDLHAAEVPDYGLKPGTVLGHEFAGTVLRSEDPGWRPGDRAAVIPFALCAECEPVSMVPTLVLMANPPAILPEKAEALS